MDLYSGFCHSIVVIHHIFFRFFKAIAMLFRISRLDGSIASDLLYKVMASSSLFNLFRADPLLFSALTFDGSYIQDFVIVL